MVDRYEPHVLVKEGGSGVPVADCLKSRDGEYILHSDYAALCEAVREWDRLEKRWVSACDSRCPEEADEYGARAVAARKHMLDLANQ